MLIQTKTALFFIDLLSGRVKWSRTFSVCNPKVAVARDFVVTDQAIYMLLDLRSPEGNVLVLLEFCFETGSFQALDVNFREAVEKSSLSIGERTRKVVVNIKHGSFETTDFQLSDMQSTWTDEKKLYVIVKRNLSYEVLSLPLQDVRTNFNSKFKAIVDV